MTCSVGGIDQLGLLLKVIGLMKSLPALTLLNTGSFDVPRLLELEDDLDLFDVVLVQNSELSRLHATCSDGLTGCFGLLIAQVDNA